jgi:hypothetical protein
VEALVWMPMSGRGGSGPGQALHKQAKPGLKIIGLSLAY